LICAFLIPVSKMLSVNIMYVLIFLHMNLRLLVCRLNHPAKASPLSADTHEKVFMKFQVKSASGDSLAVHQVSLQSSRHIVFFLRFCCELPQSYLPAQPCH